MKTFLIEYDLGGPYEQAQKLIEQIKKIGDCWHYQDSTWIVKSNATANSIRDLLGTFIDTHDRLLVISLTGELSWAGFSEWKVKWLRENMIPR